MPCLTVGTKFYLLKTNGHIRLFIHQTRIPIDFTAIADGSEEEFKRNKHMYGVRGRYTVAYGEWRFAVRVQFT